ncbi:MAG TPA: DNA internalization-related competence protein ComEC/Rec2 [Gemmatimonadota bacterium]|nr:DNA internalization-related competence protein ComEC/Rec2 [Gemmatimonadota bacterium]
MGAPASRAPTPAARRRTRSAPRRNPIPEALSPPAAPRPDPPGGTPARRPVATRIAPAAFAAAVLIGTGLAAGCLRPLAGVAVLITGTAALWKSGRPRLWAAACLLAGVRLVMAVEGAEGDGRAWARIAAGGGEPAVRALVRLTAVRPLEGGRWSVRGQALECPRPCAGATLAWSWSGGPAPRVDERWRIRGRLAVEPLRVSPGSRFPPPGLAPPSRRARLLDARVETRRPPPAPILSTAERHLRERIEARFGSALAPLAIALLLGDRLALGPALVDAFTTTGTLHILSVSGLHVGFLAGLLAFALRLTGASPVRQAAAATALVAVYAALVGGRPPVVRSAIMAGVVFWSRAGERRVSVWQAWGSAAVAILAWRPLDLFDLGFLLSFGALAGLLAFSESLGRLLAGGPGQTLRAGPAAGAGTGPAERAGRLLAVLSGGLVATTAASAGTLPLQAAAFGWIAPAGFLVNPIAVPLAAAGLPLAWLALAADALGLELLAAPLSTAAATTLAALQATVAFAAERAPVWVPGPAGWAAGTAALLVAGARLARRRPGAAFLAAGAALALLLAARPPDRPGWEVVWLDVGQGDAIVLHFPDGGTWLVDAGPADPFGDTGRRVVLPYLRRRAVRALEWLITTHPDLDHVGGAASVVQGIPVRRWGSGGAVAEVDAYLGLLAARGLRGPPRAVVLTAGRHLDQGGVRVDVLHPGPGWVEADPYAERRPANEASVVLLLSYGACRLLLTGDLGAPGETALVATLGDSLEATLLHMGHHGSNGSSTAAFLARVEPRDAIVSVGRRNLYGHPHPDALARLAAAGARVHRTDRLGTITARCRADGWHVRSAGPYLEAAPEL